MMLKKKIKSECLMPLLYQFNKKMVSEQMASTFSISERTGKDQPVIGKEKVTEYFCSLNTFNLTEPNGLILGYFQN